jgi:RND family efflux transporter MFP subunit
MNPEIEEPSQTEPVPQIPADPAPRARLGTRILRAAGSRLRWFMRPKRNRLLLVLVLAVLSISLWRSARHSARAQVPVEPATLPVVAVARVTRADLYNELTIPAEFRPYLQVDLHAKVSGYIQELNVDFGDRVKAGQLLARLEVPELQDELERAMAAEQRAEADYHEANLIYTRTLAAARADKEHPLISQQDVDTAESKDHTMQAALNAAKSDVEKYQAMVSYTRITAPFDGVITKRYADPGALIQAGTTSATQSLPLLQVSDNYRLRLDFPVPVDHVKDAHLGDQVDVRVDSLDGRVITGTISRLAYNVDDATRTMPAEIEVPNPDLQLVPGMYATLVFRVERRLRALAVLTQAVAESKTVVFVVNPQHEIEERHIKLGLETPTQYEVLAGLKEGDLVLTGGRSHFQLGEKVEPKLIGVLAQGGEGLAQTNTGQEAQ